MKLFKKIKCVTIDLFGKEYKFKLGRDESTIIDNVRPNEQYIRENQQLNISGYSTYSITPSAHLINRPPGMTGSSGVCGVAGYSGYSGISMPEYKMNDVEKRIDKHNDDNNVLPKDLFEL